MVPTWLACGLIILEMKADNELAISLPVYFESVKKKLKIWLKNKTERAEKKERSFPWQGRTPDLGRVTSTHDLLPHDG